MQTFISHTSKDDAFVKALRQALEISDIRAWADSRELAAGDLLQPEIEQAIAKSEAVDDNVEHIFKNVPAGDYEIVVHQPTGDEIDFGAESLRQRAERQAGLLHLAS